MATDGCCLSDLPDDLLLHILSFAPAREGATTAVLSRRWRSLWRTSGAVNLDSRSYGRRLCAETRRAFLRAAEAALAATRAPVRRLTLHVEIEADDHREVDTLHSRSQKSEQELHDMVSAVLSHPAARRVEELHLGASYMPMDLYMGGFPRLSYGAHPSEDLRVLHITNCCDFTPAPPGSAFPRLAEMRLQECGVLVKELQAMIDSAPQLATLHLECVDLMNDDEERLSCYRLRSPAVTALVLEDCIFWPGSVPDGIEFVLDVPRLRYLRFKGLVRLHRLSQKSQASVLDRVDLHFTDHVRCLGDDDHDVRVPFWHFLQNFNNAKALKLKLDFWIDRIAVFEKKDWNELLAGGNEAFRSLERLEIQGTYKHSSEGPGFASGGLRLKLYGAKHMVKKSQLSSR